jgi:uncharacterized protein DUF1236
MEVIHATYDFDKCRGAALAALCFQVGAQDSGPRLDQKKASPAAESNQAATSQRRNVTPERAERPAAEPMNSSVAQPEMKGRGAAKQGMKSATGPAEKAMPGEAAKKRNAGEGSMHKASAGKQPATAQGKTGEQGRRATNATEGTGIEAETKTAPRSNDRRRATEGGHHVTSSQGEVRSEPVEKLDRVDFSLSTGTVVPSYAPIRPLPERIVEIVPQYRGYDFVMVRDEIVIIEPRTRAIVTILQGEGRSAVNSPHGRLRLTSEQQQVIRRDLAREGSADTHSGPARRPRARGLLAPAHARHGPKRCSHCRSLSLFRDGRPRRPRRA